MVNNRSITTQVEDNNGQGTIIQIFTGFIQLPTINKTPEISIKIITGIVRLL